MAIDNTPPRLKLIVTIAVITVITLIAIDFATKSYFAMMSDEAKHEKIAPTRDKDDQHTAEQAAFAHRRAMPMDQAMGNFEKGQRSADITPTQSEDIAPMTGWSKLPKAPTLGAGSGARDQPMDRRRRRDALRRRRRHARLPTAACLMAPMGDAGAPATAPTDAGVRADAADGGLRRRACAGRQRREATAAEARNGGGNGDGLAAATRNEEARAMAMVVSDGALRRRRDRARAGRADAA